MILISIYYPGEIRTTYRLSRLWELALSDVYIYFLKYAYALVPFDDGDRFQTHSFEITKMTSLPLALLLLIISTSVAATKVCPGYGFMRPPTNCTSTCSNEKDDCPSNKKCCLLIREPCGYHCIVPKDNVAKVGKCPSSSSQVNNPYWNLCDGHFCDVDNDCKGTQKCCHNPCGTPLCLPPQ